MHIQEWGEEGFIEYLKTQFPSVFSNHFMGIGDDSACLPGENGKSLLITTDALVEGIHFIKDQIPPLDLGFKIVAVNVSDIAAMGGMPEYAFLSIALPPFIECSWLKNVLRGIKEACRKWNVELLGGDTVGSKRDIFFNLTLTGSALQGRLKYRHLAKPGDIICVNGTLGDSGGGLKGLQEQLSKTDDIQYLISRHFRPEPSPEEGIWLASQEGVRAMIDVSDGLDCDLHRLIKSSQCGAEIETSKIPLSESLKRTCVKTKWDILKLALAGGEDYRLLLTISEKHFDSIQALFQEKFGHPLYKIGQIRDLPTQVLYYKDGVPVEMQIRQFDHFK